MVSRNAKPASGAGGGQVQWLVGGSVCAAALEGFEHHIAHRADVGLDAFQPVSISLAVIGALLVGSLALEVQFSWAGGRADARWAMPASG